MAGAGLGMAEGAIVNEMPERLGAYLDVVLD